MRDTFDDAAGHRLSGQLTVAPLTDRDSQRLGVLTGERHDLADHLGGELGRRTAAGGVGQTRRHPGRGIRRVPSPPPVPGRLTPDPKLDSGLGNSQTGGGQQNDPRPFRQFLRC